MLTSAWAYKTILEEWNVSQMVAYNFVEAFSDVIREIIKSSRGLPPEAKKQARREELRKLELFTEDEIDSMILQLEKEDEAHEKELGSSADAP